MRWHVATTMVLATVGLVLTGCSGEPSAPTKAPEIEGVAFDKAAPGPADYAKALDTAFNSILWDSVVVTFDRARTADYTLQVPGYPADRPLYLHVEVDPISGGETYPSPRTATIYVPAAPVGGGYLDIPRDCLIYRYKNLPPPGAIEAVLQLPVMPWNRTDSYSGHFAAFTLERSADGGLTVEYGRGEVMENWPPLTPDCELYMTATIEKRTDLVDPSNAVVRAGEAPKPGEN